MSEQVQVVCVSNKWPFLRLVPYVAPTPVARAQSLYVVLPDGRTGVIDHEKPEGYLGVRPLHPETGEFLPNTSQHWTAEQRAAYPDEVAVHKDHVRQADKSELPKALR